jgi:UrcA family protein
MSPKPFLILIAVALTSNAQASVERERILSVSVSHADLDLTRAADAGVLLKRFEAAAWKACGGDPRRHPSYEVMPRYVREAFAECRADAVARAVDEVGSPVLSRAHAEHECVD